MPEKKYGLTDETIEIDGHTLHRIKALRDFGNVKKGELGGFIEKEGNLSHKGNCWIYDDACVYENAKVYDDARVNGFAKVYGNTEVFGGARITDYASIYGDAKITGEAVVEGRAKISTGKVLKGTINGSEKKNIDLD